MAFTVAERQERYRQKKAAERQKEREELERLRALAAKVEQEKGE